MSKSSIDLEYTGCYSEWREDEEYGAWGADLDNTATGLRLATCCGDTAVDFHVEKGDTLWAVWVNYSSGDSFGSSTGNIELLGCYKTKEDAEYVAKQVQSGGDEEYILKFVLPSGGKEEIYCSAFLGYFESLESVNVDIFEVK